MKRLAFTGLMLLVPVLFFVALEAGLRLADYGDDPPLFVTGEAHPEYRYQNPDVARRYFSRVRRLPYSIPDYFLTDKPENGLRIFVQGGSSAAGYPFYFENSFSRLLKQRLEQTYVNRRVEVVNTALTAVNSYTLLDMADEIIAEQPDAVLIYAGHNEYYGALGAASTETLSRFPGLVRLTLRLRRFRTMQALRDLISPDLEGEGDGRSLMERMVREQEIPYRSELYRRGVHQFSSNLSRLLERYREAGIPVFIATLASNEGDQPPFIGDSARVYFEQGRALEQAGRYSAARGAYLTAKDRDHLRFRAPEVFNRIIREEAALHDAVVVDVQERLSMATPNGIIGETLMLEHLHPNLDGYLLFADAFYEGLVQSDFFGAPRRVVPLEAARHIRWISPVDSLVGMLRIRELKSGWPFAATGPPTFSADTLTARTPIERIAHELYRDEINWEQATRRLSDVYLEREEHVQAFQAARLLIRQYPFDDTAYLLAGSILIKAERFQDALNYVMAANQRRESLESLRMAGALWFGLQRPDRAIPFLERAARLAPDDPETRQVLRDAYAAAGRD